MSLHEKRQALGNSRGVTSDLEEVLVRIRSGSDLKSPFPYFGGKSKVAKQVWRAFGDVDNYVEPFCGSAAVLLARPGTPKIETVNDYDCYVSNFWRATSKDPDAVAEHADWPVNEADLHARHRWLVLSDEARAFRERMRKDPEHYDPKIAGWWCWGLCCWIGGGWCKSDQLERHENATPQLLGDRGVQKKGVLKDKVPLPTGRGTTARTRHDVGSKEPVVQPGVLAEPKNWPGSNGPNRRPAIDHGHGSMDGVVKQNEGRPQLADAYARGRGVHGNDGADTCAARRAWLLDWFRRLRNRLRTVRVCCGDWLRVCDSESVTTRLGTTGIFFDPPYSAEADRCMDLYASESGTVARDVRAYCLERGEDKRMRIALCGYEGEGHEELEKVGWSVVKWKASGGYGNRSEKGKDNARRERIWFSPGCSVARRGFFF